ncbi:hypothetical protein ACYOEI_09935 [Singulisphaera rosea]
MRQIRFRIGLRTVMILVMFSALLSWVGVRVVPWALQMRERSAIYGALADALRNQPQIDLQIADEVEARARKFLEWAKPEDTAAQQQGAIELAWAAHYRKMAEYHAALERWYRRAAARPWETIPPMPEEPEPELPSVSSR